jgi:chemotaxis methyl-accepting protein methylase
MTIASLNTIINMSVDLHALDIFLTILNKAKIAIYYNQYRNLALTNISNFF